MNQPWPTQAFILSEELIDATSMEEVEATFADMETMDLAKPPFPTYDVIVPECKIIRVVNSETGESQMVANSGMVLRVRYYPDDTHQWLISQRKVTVDLARFVLRGCEERGWEALDRECWTRVGQAIRKLLIVILATRNAVKQTTECKLLKYGIGSKEKNRYTTTIKVGKVTEYASHDAAVAGTGREVRPHLRRGHARRQHYGPNRELIKQVFIQPVFVNADRGWIAERTAYNVSAA